ncbi:fatty acyl-CoA reductase 3-like [Macadamia integrifolia]|uniref:fatty acyl-CoA reductase 3-like n=1 Tax=Macadamia integrifolia TaxID=60698 RepID=UPI001C4E9AF8|nr:fatty acyl-CoA reductase 3-like [Macadamia integrifolia]
MELTGIVQSLQHKSILVTGAAGFLAKIFVEKVLRVQPSVKKLYLLLRAADAQSAAQRLHKEVIGKDVFRVLREKCGAGLDSFVAEKVTAVAGDIACDNLGIDASDLREEMWKEIDIIVNIAATTNFDERYDVSLGVNAMGAKYVLSFAKRCVKLQMLLHVSTAYVAGEQGGLILEKPFRMGETLNGRPGLDMERELKLVEEKLKELKALECSKSDETFAMKELGINRARHYGWPNTYVFTKCLGEMLIGQSRENLPVVIIRPTIITSTYREPFPGWVEGMRTIDSLGVGYGKGRITCFLGDPESIVDVIPGDMVVNAMIVAMVAHANQHGEFIYQVGSSVRNPAKFTLFQDYGYQFFSKHPCIDKDGKPIKVGKVAVFSTMDSFHKYMAVRYMLPLKALQLLNIVSCQYFQNLCSNFSRKINFVMRLVELYRPYLFFRGVFDDLNLEKLRMAMKDNGAEENIFCFDPKCISWDDYFLNIHLPGLIRYVFK